MRSIELILGKFRVGHQFIKRLPAWSAPCWDGFPTTPYMREALAPDFREALGTEIEYYGCFANNFFVFSVNTPGMEDTFILLHSEDMNGMVLGRMVPKVKELVYDVPSGELIRERFILSRNATP